MARIYRIIVDGDGDWYLIKSGGQEGPYSGVLLISRSEYDEVKALIELADPDACFAEDKATDFPEYLLNEGKGAIDRLGLMFSPYSAKANEPGFWDRWGPESEVDALRELLKADPEFFHRNWPRFPTHEASA